MPTDQPELEGPKAACETFIQQTKLLTSLASAFVVAPVLVKPDSIEVTGWLLAAEIALLVSLLAGYVTLAAVAGTQHKGKFNVYAPTIRVFAHAQFFPYVIGVALFLYWLVGERVPPT
ncbi:MAG: hypothetical protein AAF726_11440 [Planctomycetota bacterium]